MICDLMTHFADAQGDDLLPVPHVQREIRFTSFTMAITASTTGWACCGVVKGPLWLEADPEAVC